MPQFIKLSTDWMYSPVLCRIEHQYNGAGVAFYIKAISRIARMGGHAPRIYLLSLRSRPLRWSEAEAILDNYGLFELDEKGNYMVAKRNPENGLVSSLSESASCTCASGAGTEACTEARTDGCTAAGGGACTTGVCDAPVILDELEENIRVEMEAEQKFFSFMHNECPHLLELPEPMNFDQLKLLRQDFSADEIRDVLRDMENKPDLSVRSCYKTARKWLHHRKQ